MDLTFDAIKAAVGKTGLSCRGGFHPNRGLEGLPYDVRTLILIGDVGGAFWDRFVAERRDEPDPLDGWTERVLGPVAHQLGGQTFYPFGGPPHWPFQTWGMRAEGLKPAPIGPLMHPDAGPWHSYRGAMGFAQIIDLPASPKAAHPCDSCADQPCLSACPVNAFSGEAFPRPEFNLEACLDHLTSDAGSDCMSGGCLARRACPAGIDAVYRPDHQAYLANWFVQAFRVRTRD